MIPSKCVQQPYISGQRALWQHRGRRCRDARARLQRRTNNARASLTAYTPASLPLRCWGTMRARKNSQLHINKFVYIICIASPSLSGRLLCFVVSPATLGRVTCGIQYTGKRDRRFTRVACFRSRSCTYTLLTARKHIHSLVSPLIDTGARHGATH